MQQHTVLHPGIAERREQMPLGIDDASEVFFDERTLWFRGGAEMHDLQMGRTGRLNIEHAIHKNQPNRIQSQQRSRPGTLRQRPAPTLKIRALQGLQRRVFPQLGAPTRPAGTLPLARTLTAQSSQPRRAVLLLRRELQCLLLEVSHWIRHPRPQARHSPWLPAPRPDPCRRS